MGENVTASLSIRVQQEGIDSAATSMSRLTQAGGTLEQQMSRLHSSLDQVDRVYEIFGNATQANAQKQQILRQQIESLCAQGYDKLTPEVQRLKMAYDALEPAQAKTGSGFGNLAMQIAGFSTGIGLAVQAGQATIRWLKETGAEAITLAASFEKSRMQWGVLVGDMQKGSKVFDQIYSFSAKTPLSFDALNQAATTIKGFGVATEDIIPTLSKLGDVAMGDNNKLQSLALVYGQVMAQGKAKTQDLYQFINAGVPIFQLLADSMGKNSGEIKNLAADGAVTFVEIEKAIEKATSQGGQFYDMMDKTAETISGKWSTALDNWKQVLASIGNETLPIINKALDAFNNGATAAADLAQEKKNSAIISAYNAPGAEWVRELMQPKQQNEEIIAYHDAIVSEIEIENRRLEMYKYSDAERTEHLGRIQQYYRALDSISRKYGAAYSAEHPADSGSQLTADQIAIQDAISSLRLEFQKLDQENAWATSQGKAFDLVSERARVLDKIVSDLIAKGFSISGPGVQALIKAAQDLGYYSGPVNLPAGSQSPDAAAEAAQAAGIQDAISSFGSMGIATLPKVVNDTKDLERALVRVNDAFVSIGQQGFVSIFQSLGEAMASGADGADTLGEALANIGKQILDQMPLLLLQAGLSAIVAGQWAVGLALVGASGVVAIGSGAANYLSENALGGVYSSPSLHQYANGVYDQPRLFQFASGGVFAEAGPEAIMPLTRDSSGRLGVQSTGQGGLSVHVTNNLGVQADATVSETTDSAGNKQISILLEKAVVSAIAGGKADKAMASRYGASVQGRRVN